MSEKKKRPNRANGEGTTSRKDNGKWECIIQSKYPDPDTMKPKRIKRIGNTEEEAIKRAKLAVKAWEKRNKGHTEDGAREGRSLTFGNYVFDYINIHVKKNGNAKGSTLLQYNRDYKAYIQKYAISNLQVHNLSKDVFQTYYDKLSKKYAEASIKGAVYLCGATCDWLVDRSLIEENYAKLAKVRVETVDAFDHNKPKHKEVFTLEDIRLILNAYYNNFDSEYVTVALFILETGMRTNEFQILTNDNIDYEKRVITVEKALSTKMSEDFEITEQTESIPTVKYKSYPKQTRQTMQPYFIPMSPFCVELAKKMQQKVKEKCKNNPDDYFYPVFRTGNYRSIASMEVGFKSLCDKLGIDRDVHYANENQKGNMKGLNLYALRHTKDTINNTFNTPNAIAAATEGHSLQTSLQNYTHPTKELVSKLKLPSPVEIAQREGVIEKNSNQIEIDEETEKALLRKLIAKYGTEV